MIDSGILLSIGILVSFWTLFIFGIAAQAAEIESDPTEFNFAAVGDWACNSNTENTVKNIMGKKPELILALGDLSYQRSGDCWFRIISPADNITMITRGDHDNDFRMNQYMQHFSMLREFYSFNRQNMHFLVMSTETPYGLGSEQYQFVRSDLENASRDSNIHWIIITYHQPAYTSPSNCKGCSPRVTLGEVYHPLFDKFGADLVLQAHVHNYERTYPLLYNSNDSSKPIIADKNETNYNYTHNSHGAIFATVGTGGGDLNIFQARDPYVIKQYRGFGFLNVETINNVTRLNCTFYANDGTLADHFTIDKDLKYR